MFLGLIMDVSMLFNKNKEKTIFIDVNLITPNPLQPRRRFDEASLDALAGSIKEYGVIQPIAVKRLLPLPPPMPQPTAKYEIIAGERRWRASIIAGLKSVPCRIFETDKNGSAMMALVENIQRSDLSFFEEALAMQTLLLMTEMTQNELAKALSMSQSTLSNKLRLLRLSERERLIILDKALSERHCRALVRIQSESERAPILQKIIEEDMSASVAEKFIDSYLQGSMPSKNRPKKKKPAIKGRLNMKMLFNTLDRSVSLLKASGYTASWQKEDRDNELLVTMVIKK